MVRGIEYEGNWMGMLLLLIYLVQRSLEVVGLGSCYTQSGSEKKKKVLQLQSTTQTYRHSKRQRAAGCGWLGRTPLGGYCHCSSIALL